MLTLSLSLSAGTLLAPGMVTLPGSFAILGYAEGALALVAASTAAAWSLVLLDSACKKVNKASSASYGALVASILGPAGCYALEALTLVYCLGQVVAYVGAIGAQASAIWGHFQPGHRLPVNWATAGSALLAMLPLSLLPERGVMRFAGAAGCLCMVYIVATIILGDATRAALGQGPCSLSGGSLNPVAFGRSATRLLQNLPIFLFSMNASVIYVPVRSGHGPSLRGAPGGRHLIALSVAASAMLYLSCSAAAYYAYCGGVPENVVDAWPISWVPGLFARVLLCLELLVAGAGIYVPLARASLWHLIFGPRAKAAAAGWARLAASLGILALGAAASVLLSGALALPLAVTASLCVTAQLFVLPGLAVYRSSGSVAALVFSLVGIAFGVLSLLALFGVLGSD